MAKVLQINMQGVPPANNPDQVTVATSLKIMQTGEDCIEDGPNFVLNLKVLGLYKAAAVLNAEIKTAALDYVESVYMLTDFNQVYMNGGFSTI